MAKPELGAKRQCQNCGAKFFDLNKDPIVCPKCGTIFQGAGARASAPPPRWKTRKTRPSRRPASSWSRSTRSRRARRRPSSPSVEDIDVEDDEAEPDDPFLEEEEEDDDDVTALIDGDIAPDEEP